MKITIKSILILLFLGAIIGGYVHEIPYFSNTFDVQYLFFRALFVGAFVGAGIGWHFMKKAGEHNDPIPIFMICLVLCMIIFPLKAIFANHFFAKNTPLSIKVPFEKEEPLRTSRFGVAKNTLVTVDAFYVYFLKDGKIDRIRSKTQSFQNIEKGQEIELPVKKGFLGFDFVDIR